MIPKRPVGWVSGGFRADTFSYRDLSEGPLLIVTPALKGIAMQSADAATGAAKADRPKPLPVGMLVNLPT